MKLDPSVFSCLWYALMSLESYRVFVPFCIHSNRTRNFIHCLGSLFENPWNGNQCSMFKVPFFTQVIHQKTIFSPFLGPLYPVSHQTIRKKLLFNHKIPFSSKVTYRKPIFSHPSGPFCCPVLDMIILKQFHDNFVLPVYKLLIQGDAQHHTLEETSILCVFCINM